MIPDEVLLQHLTEIKEEQGRTTEAITAIHTYQNKKDKVCEQHKEVIDKISDRVNIIENDKKWSAKIGGFVAGTTGALLVILAEFFLNRGGK